MRPVSSWQPVLRILLALSALMLAFASTAAKAELPARPDGPILDAANILPANQKAALDQKLRAYNKATGRAIIVATVPSLDGSEPERYAQDLARAWGIGGAESQEGVLFLIAPTERKVRIQTSVGAQGRLTDGFVGETLRTVVTPKFKAGDYPGGITAGVDALIAQMDRDPVDAKAVSEAAETAAAQRAEHGGSSGSSFVSVIFWLIVLIILIGAFGRGSRRYGARRSGIDPGVVLWGISEVMRHGSQSGGWSGGGFGSDDGGFGGFGGGGGGFDGGGASGDW